MNFNKSSMPVTFCNAAKDIKFSDFILIHHIGSGRGNFWLASWELRKDCKVAQILSIDRFGARTVFKTDIGQVDIDAMSDGSIIKVDMSNHLLSPARQIAIAHNLKDIDKKLNR